MEPRFDIYSESEKQEQALERWGAKYDCCWRITNHVGLGFPLKECRGCADCPVQGNEAALNEIVTIITALNKAENEATSD